MASLKRGEGVLAAPTGAIWIGLIGYIVTTGIGFAAVAAATWTQSTHSVDVWLHSMANPGLDWIADRLAAIDETAVVTVILLFGGLLITFWRGWLPAIGFMAIAGVGWLLIAAVKAVVSEPRPAQMFTDTHQSLQSYPSGHVTFVMALTVAAGAALAGSRWRWPVVIVLSLLTLATAWSRLYFGVHYPMDVVGGILGGLSGAFLVLGVWNLFMRRLKL